MFFQSESQTAKDFCKIVADSENEYQVSEWCTFLNHFTCRKTIARVL